MTHFSVVRDEMYGFIVIDSACRAKSFAMVPVSEAWSFNTRTQAVIQAKALMGKDIPCRMIETPDRFEAVADTNYGPAWE